LRGLVVNQTKGNLKICAIKTPGFGNNKHDMLVDLSAITGAKIYDHSCSFKDFKEEDFGVLKKCIISRSASLFLANHDRQEAISNRVEFVKDQLTNEMLEDNELITIKHRLTQLSGGIALLRIGASTEAEMLERRDRVDDALSATRAAMQEGIVAGGGVAIASAILNITSSLDEDQIGIDILKHACFAPITQIVKNTGKSADLVIEKIHESGKKDFGYDARNEKFGNMFELGVIDPLKVVRCSLQNASSAATLLLTSECAMVNEITND
jgi:chaperonin GroEL